MSEISIDEAEAFGLRLTKEQEGLLHGDYNYVLVPQVMPDPLPYYVEGRRRSFWAHDDDEHRGRRVVIPTIMEVATGLDARDLHAEEYLYASQLHWDTLPTITGWAVDMPEVAANDNWCQHLADADLTCGCYYLPPQIISPYSVVPIEDFIARDIMEKATQGLACGSWVPMKDLAEIGNGLVGDPEEDPELMQRLECAEEYIRQCPDFTSVHVPSSEMSYPLDQYEALGEKLKRQLIYNGRAMKGILGADRPALLSAYLTLFAYPNVDDEDLHRFYRKA